VSAQAQASLLDNLLATPLYRLTLGNEQADQLRVLLGSSKPYPAEMLHGALPVQRWELLAGEPRNLDALFAAIDGAYVEHLTVRDPYCAASDGQLRALEALLEFLLERAQNLAKLTVHCRELGRRDERYQAPFQVETALNATLAGLSGLDRETKLEVYVHPRRDSYDFHDRTLDLTIITQDGTSQTQRYDLTGGVDYLMDVNRSIKVFRYNL